MRVAGVGIGEPDGVLKRFEDRSAAKPEPLRGRARPIAPAWVRTCAGSPVMRAGSPVMRAGSPGLSIAALTLSLFMLPACVTNEFPPEPSTDEEGLAIVSALNLTQAQAECSDEGVYWPQWDSEQAPVLTGVGGGSAGILKGLLEIVDHLNNNAFSDDAQSNGDLLPWLQLLKDGELWLQRQGIADADAGLYWPQCVAVPGVQADSTCAVSSHPGGSRTCDEAQLLPAAGLADGSAGIGNFYLALYEKRTLFQGTDEESYAEENACRWLDTAVSVGDWLLATECRADATARGAWAAVGTDCQLSPPRTGIADGSAGIGYFFLRLFLVTGRTDFLYAASRAGAFLHDQLISYATEDDQAQFSVSVEEGSAETQTGLYEGNAGVAYYLLALSTVQATTGEVGKSSQSEADASGILAWLQDDEVRESTLGGYAWLSSPEAAASAARLGEGPQGGARTTASSSTSTTNTVSTGLEDGAAGVGWVFLQASRLGVDGALDNAEGAGRYLSHALVAHYYQGRVWWPDLIEPWEDAVQGETDADASSGADAGQRYRYMPGMRRGISGVASFLFELEQESGVQCAATLSDEAAHWLYLRGRPQNTSLEQWRWPEVVERYTSGDELVGRTGASLDFGTMGVVTYLAMDRAGDLNNFDGGGSSVLGLQRLPLEVTDTNICSGSRHRH